MLPWWSPESMRERESQLEAQLYLQHRRELPDEQRMREAVGQPTAEQQRMGRRLVAAMVDALDESERWRGGQP